MRNKKEMGGLGERESGRWGEREIGRLGGVEGILKK